MKFATELNQVILVTAPEKGLIHKQQAPFLVNQMSVFIAQLYKQCIKCCTIVTPYGMLASSAGSLVLVLKPRISPNCHLASKGILASALLVIAPLLSFHFSDISFAESFLKYNCEV